MLSNLDSFFSFESTSRAIARETEHSGRHPQEGCRGMCSDPLDPGGEVRGCFVGCTLGMLDISPSRVPAACRSIWSFQHLKNAFFTRVCVGCGGISCFLRGRSTTVGTCRTILTRRRFVSHVVLLDESSISYFRALVRWATGKTLINRLPKLSLVTLSLPGTDRIYGSMCHQHTWFQFLGIQKYLSDS